MRRAAFILSAAALVAARSYVGPPDGEHARRADDDDDDDEMYREVPPRDPGDPAQPPSLSILEEAEGEDTRARRGAGLPPPRRALRWPAARS